MKHIVDINYYFEETGAADKSKTGTESYISIPEEVFNSTMENISGKDIILIGLFCLQNFDGHTGFTLLYVLEKRNCSRIVIIERHLHEPYAGSAAALFPSASWFEREITDGFGLLSRMLSTKDIFFLHEVYPEGLHPLRKDFKNKPVVTRETVHPDSEYVFKKVTGEGVYQIPVGRFMPALSNRDISVSASSARQFLIWKSGCFISTAALKNWRRAKLRNRPCASPKPSAAMNR